MTRNRYMTPAERDECVNLYQAGATIFSLADRYERDNATIDRLIRKRAANRGYWPRRGRVLSPAHIEAVRQGNLRFQAAKRLKSS